MAPVSFPYLGHGCVCPLVSCLCEAEGVSLWWLALSSAYVSLEENLTLENADSLCGVMDQI